MIIVLMGMAGSGKTTVGRALASELQWPFHDADDFHSPGNVAKMRSGTPLADDDREPWLLALQALVREIDEAETSAVIACSALSRSFRERLRAEAKDLRYVYLKAAPELLEERLRNRRDHYFGPSLLASQFAALEEPEDAITIPLDHRTPQQVATSIRELLYD